MAISMREAGKLGYLKNKKVMLDRIEQAHKKALEKFKKLDKKCRLCGKPILYKKRRNDFCSHTCAAIINNQGRVRNRNGSLAVGERIENTNTFRVIPKPSCIVCGKQVKVQIEEKEGT